MHGCVVRDKGKRGRDVYTYLHKFVLVCMRFALCMPITCECSCVCVLCVGRDRGRGVRDCMCVIAYIGVHGCMFVCVCVKCICIVCAHHL